MAAGVLNFAAGALADIAARKVDFDNFTRWSTKTALKIENF